MKKSISLSVIVLMMISLLMGCTLFEGTGSSKDDERMEESDNKDSKKDKKRHSDEPELVTEMAVDPDEEIEDSLESGMRNVFAYYAMGDYMEVPIVYAYATSQLDIEKDYYKYHPENLYDGDTSTAYVEGTDGDGIGEMVRFYFGIDDDRCTYPITRIKVWPGYQKSKEVFENNSVPTLLEFYFTDGSMVDCEVPENYRGDGPISISLPKPVLATGCTMLIADAVSGKKYNDCCISEIEFDYQETDGMMYYGHNTSSGDAKFTYEIDAYLGDEMYWSYTTNNMITELTSSNHIFAFRKGTIYAYDDGKIIAIDGLTGNKIWENEEFGGYPIAWDFDDAGNLYLCGYYGPDLAIIDKDGNTVRRSTDITDDTVCWPNMIIVNKGINEGKVSIYYNHCDGYDDYHGIIITVDK